MNDAGAEPASASAADVRGEPLYIDTGAFFAYYNDRDEHHDSARAVFQAIQAGDLAYGPLYTTRYVLGELAALLLYKIDHATASRALGDIRAADSFNVERVGEASFAEACAEFDRYDDQGITLVDHVTAVLARERERDADRVVAYDSDFSTLGVVRVPLDTGEP
jgi:predicted nucleic acid-binding protein